MAKTEIPAKIFHIVFEQMQKVTETVTNSEQSFRRIALVVLLYLIPSVHAMLPVDDPDM